MEEEEDEEEYDDEHGEIVKYQFFEILSKINNHLP